MEILAPAGNREALDRAATAGADAVYLGAAAFNARAGAGNFGPEALREAIRYAHLRHIRVYVTVNTLVKDSELADIRQLLGQLREMKADGILVQDAGVLRMAEREFPELRIHASTQMAIHNAAGVRWCAKHGMTRVVLARECGLEEIRACAQVGPEIEVFGHGAQCVAVSGLCLFSSMVGGRSGNRGRCAQPCRMEYRFRGKAGAWLSPRDNCLRNDLPALAEAGAASLKIEGRLKRPEYAEIVTESYRRGEDGRQSGGFRPADREEETALRQIFNRGDFMRGYALGCEDAGVIDPAHVNHRGVEIGRVEEARGNLARVRLTANLHDGDGLRIVPGPHDRKDAPGPDGRGKKQRDVSGGKPRDEAELIYAGKDTEAGDMATLRLREGLGVFPGDRVFRLTDERQLRAAREKQASPIPVEMILKAWPGQPLTLTVSDGESIVTVAGEETAPAESRAADEDSLRRSLGKTGGTGFSAQSIRVETAGAFVPVSALNALRRQIGRAHV